MKKKSSELFYANSAKINMGDFEQLSPFYSLKITFDNQGEDVDLDTEYEKMRESVDTLLRMNIDNVKNAKKAKEIGNFRFYDKNGKKYISVTSVLNPIPKTPEEEARLKPYGDRGTILHRHFSSYITDAVLTPITVAEEDNCAEVGGFLGYEFWFKDDPNYDFRSSEITLYNDEHEYAGRCDADGFYGKEPALYDLKSGSLNNDGIEKAFLQLAAYNACYTEPRDLLIILPIGPKAKKAPLITRGADIKKYFEMFLAKRKSFKVKYGC